jgi:adenosylmethionine-8-amino-7-oxononanoate aminotransferase
MHFTRIGADVPIIARGEGCYVWDVEGRRYLDGLSALFCVNAGHGRVEIVAAAAAQMRELAFYQLWNYAHPPAIELADRLAGLAPEGLERAFFTSGGSESVETAVKLARTYHRLKGHANRTRIIARETFYHGTTLGALSVTGIDALRAPFEPLMPGVRHVPNTGAYRGSADRDPLWAADEIERAILEEGPETVAAVILEPIQNAGGCLTPPPGYWPRVREICDRHRVLLVADETISAWGRIGYYFGVERYGGRPDLLTTAKGITSAYVPLGVVLVSDAVAASFVEHDAAFQHGLTFAGHPVATAAANANLDIFAREGLCERVLEYEDAFREAIESLRDVPIVGDVRGAGYFWALELVRDQDTGERYTRQEQDRLLRGIIGPAMLERGLLARADNRGEPIVQVCPPLVAGPDQFDEIVDVLRPVLADAHRRMGAR